MLKTTEFSLCLWTEGSELEATVSGSLLPRVVSSGVPIVVLRKVAVSISGIYFNVWRRLIA